MYWLVYFRKFLQLYSLQLLVLLCDWCCTNICSFILLTILLCCSIHFRLLLVMFKCPSVIVFVCNNFIFSSLGYIFEFWLIFTFEFFSCWWLHSWHSRGSWCHWSVVHEGRSTTNFTFRLWQWCDWSFTTGKRTSNIEVKAQVAKIQWWVHISCCGWS